MTNKDLISQYVDTGLELPEYQVSKLPNWALKTYLRKRLIGGFVSDFEFDMLSDEQKKKYLDFMMKNSNRYWNFFSVKQYKMLPDGEVKNKIRKNIIGDIEGSLLAGQKLNPKEIEFMNYLKL